MDGKLDDEAGRLAALHRYEVLGTAPEQPFDRITSLLKTILNVPIAAVSLVDQDRQWFKSCIGLDVRETGRNVAFCDHTIRTRQAMVVPNAALDSRFADNPLVTGPPQIVSYAGVPLSSPDGYNIGSLCIIDTVPRKFDPQQIEMLKSFAAIVVDELELRLLARTDELTGAVSRRAFIAEADKAVARYERDALPSAIVAFDVDHFKQINDTYGHPAGDKVLRGIGACISTMIRPADAFGRLGGEEFAVLLADTELDAACIAAERFRDALEQLVTPHNVPIRITASFGIAALGGECVLREAWLASADTELYRAKQSGRNRCCARRDAELEKAVAFLKKSSAKNF
jgi:diguanylate cyclase (GGDEF)-like protein